MGASSTHSIPSETSFKQKLVRNVPKIYEMLVCSAAWMDWWYEKNEWIPISLLINGCFYGWKGKNVKMFYLFQFSFQWEFARNKFGFQ